MVQGVKSATPRGVLKGMRKGKQWVDDQVQKYQEKAKQIAEKQLLTPKDIHGNSLTLVCCIHTICVFSQDRSCGRNYIL